MTTTVTGHVTTAATAAVTAAAIVLGCIAEGPMLSISLLGVLSLLMPDLVMASSVCVCVCVYV